MEASGPGGIRSARYQGAKPEQGVYVEAEFWCRY